MPGQRRGSQDGWLSRYRQRRADRRARRGARVGVDPNIAVAQARSWNFQSGGFFTKTGPKP